jgi:hypothetical protein
MKNCFDTNADTLGDCLPTRRPTAEGETRPPKPTFPPAVQACHDLVQSTCPDCFTEDGQPPERECIDTCFSNNADTLAGCIPTHRPSSVGGGGSNTLRKKNHGKGRR